MAIAATTAYVFLEQEHDLSTAIQAATKKQLGLKEFLNTDERMSSAC
jgi:hypothetical protein